MANERGEGRFGRRLASYLALDCRDARLDDAAGRSWLRRSSGCFAAAVSIGLVASPSGVASRAATVPVPTTAVVGTAPAAPDPTIKATSAPIVRADALAVYVADVPSADAMFSGVTGQATDFGTSSVVRYSRLDDSAMTYLTITAVAMPAGLDLGRVSGDRVTVNGRTAVVFPKTSDGERVGWTAIWSLASPVGRTIAVDGYYMEKAQFVAMLPSVRAADPALAATLIAASDPQYRNRLGPASTDRKVTSGRNGNLDWQLIVSIPPGYPIPTWERRQLCWRIERTSSPTQHGPTICPERPATVWMRSDDRRIVAVVAQPPAAIAKKSILYPVTFIPIDRGTRATPLAAVKGRALTVPGLGAAAVVAAVPSETCWVLLHPAAPQPQAEVGDAFDSDPNDPCTQALSTSSQSPPTTKKRG